MDSQERNAWLQKYDHYLHTPRTLKGYLSPANDIYWGTILVRIAIVGVILSIVAIIVRNL